MPRVRNEFLPQDLRTIYTSPTGMADLRTGLPYYAGGLNVGDYVELTEAEAQALSGSQLHWGKYRFVKLDSGATSGNVKTGTIGLMKTLAGGVNLVTSYDAGLNAALRPVVFINTPTAAQVAAGAYVWVQEAGDANVLAAGTITASAGTTVQSTTLGVVNNGTTNPIGVAQATASAGALFRCLLNLPWIGN